MSISIVFMVKTFIRSAVLSTKAEQTGYYRLDLSSAFYSPERDVDRRGSSGRPVELRAGIWLGILKLWLALFVLIVPVAAEAKMETYDLITLDVPKGWGREMHDNRLDLIRVNKKSGAWCGTVLYKAIDSTGSPEADFTRDWKVLAFDLLKAADERPQTKSSELDGWKVISASSTFSHNGSNAIVLLTNLTGYGKSVSLVSMTNTQELLADIDKLLQSVRMVKPAATITSTNSSVKANGSNEQITGMWIKKSGGASPGYGNTASWNNAGYSANEYIFKNDGTYEFYSKTFRMALPEMYLIKENGVYTVDNNKLTITPSSSTIESWSKKDNTDKWGERLSSNSRKLEKTTYTFTKHYFTGIQEWNLVLQTNNRTDRDGPFGSNPTFQDAYYYATPSPNLLPIELPGHAN